MNSDDDISGSDLNNNCFEMESDNDVSDSYLNHDSAVVVVDDDDDGDKVKNFIILNEENIRKRQEEDINEVSTVLSVSKASASILLLHNKWSVTEVKESWFTDEEQVRMTVGLLLLMKTDDDDDDDISRNNNNKKLKMACGICFDEYPISNLYDSGYCYHLFCYSCWESYITISIHDGSECLKLRCPEHKCAAAVDQDMVNTFVSQQQDKHKYSDYLLKSYVEDNRKIKWCPAPSGCVYAVDYNDVDSSDNYNVSCDCGYCFCWKCTQDDHSPVDCETVANWIFKNQSESENINWILVYSKPCPKCNRPIQKNQGCNHMTCKCGHHFCWLCLSKTGKDHYACNSYIEAKNQHRLVQNEGEQRQQMAKILLDKYAHYYERWQTNKKSMGKAKEDLELMKTVITEMLMTKNPRLQESHLQFIIEAWKQIIECRRVLKWTYAYGYYFPEHEHTKKNFFEYLQGEAESGLERLHHCAEKELQVHLKADAPSRDFKEFRTKLIGLTVVTGDYFDKLVKALQGGLADVDSLGDSSKGKGTNSAGLEVGVLGLWSCEHCTYSNEESATICEMCNKQQGSWSCEDCTSVNDRFDTVCSMCYEPRAT